MQNIPFYETPSVKSDAQAHFIKGDSDKYFFNTEIPFLREHNGYRPKCLHLFIGSAGGGKSSLLFAQIFDLIKCNPKAYAEGRKVGIYLSEEKMERFRVQLVKMGLYGPEKSKITDCIKVFSEKDYRIKNNLQKIHYSDILNIMQDFIFKESLSILFIDNITTTDPYLDDRHEEISPLAKGLANLSDKANIPLVVYAHTKGDIESPDFSMEDIRQKKTIVNLAEFCYLIHRYHGSNINSELQIRKYRGYPVKNNFYGLIYNFDMGIIQSYIPSSLHNYRAKNKQYREIGKEK